MLVEHNDISNDGVRTRMKKNQVVSNLNHYVHMQGDKFLSWMAKLNLVDCIVKREECSWATDISISTDMKMVKNF